jgi:predicted enzyme related to lactoylglutathione lyase
VVDDLGASQKKVESEGGQFFMKLPSFPGVDAESKFKDPNGVVFDMSEHDWQQAN